jgi:hypothetical protein
LTDIDARPPRPRLPILGVDLDAIHARYQAIHSTRTRLEFHTALVASVADVPTLVSEVDRLWGYLVQTRRRYADLLAAVRAALAADRDGEADPLWYVRDEFAAQAGQWP